MTDLAKRTWPEAQALFGPDTVALLPIGSRMGRTCRSTPT